MDTKNKILSFLTVCGIVMCVVGANYIPQPSGPIPQGMSLDEFNRERQQAALNSMEFKVTMSGLGLMVCSILSICIRVYIRKEEIPDEFTRTVVPILKVTRVMPIQDTSINIMELQPMGNSRPIIQHIPLHETVN